MKPTFPLFAVVLACLTVMTARADDAAVQQMRTARAALVNAKAWRRTTILTNLDDNQAGTFVAEAIQPNLFRLTFSGTEYLSDGKVHLVRNVGGAFVTLDPDGLKFLEFSREKYSLKGLLEGIKEAHVEERKTFRDLPSTVIAFTIDSEGMVSTGKLWISDADHLPLKIESETHGERKTESGEMRKVNQRNTGSFEYGPSIQIVMP